MAGMMLMEDVFCRGCGYNLRGLGREGRCPECGVGIAGSLLSDHLSAADGRWIGWLRRGLGCLQAAIMAGPVGLVALGVVEEAWWLWAIVGVGVGFGVAGSWMVTVREPGMRREGQWVRLAARWVLVVGLPGTAVLAGWPERWLAGAGAIAAGVTVGAGGGALFVHAARLARRARDQRLAAGLYTLGALAGMCGVLLLVPWVLTWVFGPPMPQGLSVGIVGAVGVLLSPSMFVQVGRLRGALPGSGGGARN